MRSANDDDAEMTDQLDSFEDVALLVHELRELGRPPAPAPSPELETLLLEGMPKLGRRRARRRAAVAAALVIGSTSVTCVAAAADRLPAPAADVINDLTPLHLGHHHPRPAAPPSLTRPARTPTLARPTHPRPQISSDGRELASAPPARQPAPPSETATSTNSGNDDRRGVSPSQSPSSSPSPTRTDDDTRGSTGSRTPSPGPSRAVRDR